MSVIIQRFFNSTKLHTLQLTNLGNIWFANAANGSLSHSWKINV